MKLSISVSWDYRLRKGLFNLSFHASIFNTPSSLTPGSRLCWSLPQLSHGEGRATPWTSGRFISGQRGDKQRRTAAGTPHILNTTTHRLGVQAVTSHAGLWTAGGKPVSPGRPHTGSWLRMEPTTLLLSSDIVSD